MGARRKAEGERWWDRIDSREGYSRRALERMKAREDALALVDEVYRPGYFEGLTDREWLFAKLVVERGSIKAASREAKVPSGRMMKPLVREAVAWWMMRKGVTVGEVRSRIAEIARGDLGDFLDDEGNIDIEKARAKGLTHLIKRYRVHERSNGTRTVELELYDALVALQTLARMYGMVVDKEVENNTTVVVYIPDNHRRAGVDIVDVVAEGANEEEGVEDVECEVDSGGNEEAVVDGGG